MLGILLTVFFVLIAVYAVWSYVLVPGMGKKIKSDKISKVKFNIKQKVKIVNTLAEYMNILHSSNMSG